MEYKKYSAGLMSQSFWFLEFKKVVGLRKDGLTYDEIKKKCVKENLFWSGKRISGFAYGWLYYNES